MPEIVGRMACPICGRPEQLLKANKNSNLYMYCESRCSVRLNASDSREITEVLSSGQIYDFHGMKIRPAGIFREKQQKKEVKSYEQSGNRIDGRSDRRLTGSSGDGKPEPRRNRLAEWWYDGDDDL